MITAATDAQCLDLLIHRGLVNVDIQVLSFPAHLLTRIPEKLDLSTIW